MTEQPHKFSALTEKTFLPISIVGIALVACCGGAWWLSAMYSNQLQVNTRLDRIERALSDNISNGITQKDMRTWVMLLKGQNKSLEVPEWVR